MTPDERRAAKRAIYAAHREQERKRKREWYAANADKARGHSRNWRIRNGLHADRRIAWSRWDAERIAKLRQMRADGITYVECGKALGCTADACERACDRYGIPKRKVNPNSEPVLAKHVAMHRESEAQSRMWAKLLGASA
jgi:hypothetical protein